jgi:beta-galactosidase
MDSTLFINQKEVGSWQYGYSSFEFEITDYLVIGKNDIFLRVKHEHPNSRWYSGAGIYRNVWLRAYAPTHFAANSIYISTRQEANTYKLLVSHELNPETFGACR